MIGIHSISTCYNYGALLQCWSLQQAIKGLVNVPVVHVEITSNSPLLTAKGFVKKLLKRTASESLTVAKRKEAANAFKFCCLPSVSLTKWDDVMQTKLTGLIVGSDEVLRPSLHTTDVMRGILPASLSIPVSGYAMSSGRDDSLQIMEGRFNAYGFRDVGIRDTASAKLFKTAGRTATLTLDPVFLPASNQFFALNAAAAVGESFIPEEPYTLIYSDKSPSELMSICSSLDIQGKIVVLGNVGHSVISEKWTNQYTVLEPSFPIHAIPALFASASSVITNFFHGVVFALRNEKPFYFLKNEMKAYKVLDLLTQLDALFFDSLSLASEQEWREFYNSVTPRIIAKRKSSLDYLEQALGEMV